MKKIATTIGVMVLLCGYLNAQPAKDFTIHNYDTQKEWTLKDYLGDHVIALISGSFC